MTQLSIDPEKHGTPLYDKKPSDAIFNVVLVADTVQSVVVPAGMRFAWVESTSDFFMANVTFTLPVSATFVSGDMELNPPPSVNLEGITTLFFRARGTPDITVSFYT